MPETKRIVCPAGQEVGQSDRAPRGGCLCVIEDYIIGTDERHYQIACTTEYYERCPTWRTAKDRGWKDRESDVAAMRKEAIERMYGEQSEMDKIADAVIAGEASIEDMLDAR